MRDRPAIQTSTDTSSPGLAASAAEAGFSLLELLVASFASLFVVGGMMLMLNGLQDVHRNTQEVIDAQQMARLSLEQMQRDLQLAGVGLAWLIPPFPLIAPRADGGIDIRHNQGGLTAALTADMGGPNGAIVVADAVTILSESWGDTDGDGDFDEDLAYSEMALNDRNASDTEVNAALMMGSTDTIAGVEYNGGVENVLRFLERWSGDTLTYRGSIIDLWNSVHATGTWSYGNPIYTAPNRDWAFDTDFLASWTRPTCLRARRTSTRSA